MKFTKFALASVAAFGLAGVALADDPEPSSFQGVADGLDTWFDNTLAPATGYNVNGGLGTTEAVWYGGSSADDTKVMTYTEGNPGTYGGTTRPGGMSAGSNYLKVSNSDPLWRMITPYNQVEGAWPSSFPTAGAVDVPTVAKAADAPNYDGGLYVDTLVQFTPSEDEPAVDSGSKLIVWMNSASNLCVTANALTWVDSTLTQESVSFETTKHLDVNTWYRLTVAAFSDVCFVARSGVALHGFVVYIDGTAVVARNPQISQEVRDTTAFSTWCSRFTKVWGYIGENKFFPTLDTISQTATLAAVGFKGEGLVDDIVVTDVAPTFDPAPVGGIDFTLTWGADVSAVWYSVDGGTTKVNLTTVPVEAIALPATVEAGDELIIGGTAADAWSSVAETTNTLAASGNSYTVTATAAATAGAAGVTDEVIADWTVAQVKAAFGDTVTPAKVNGARAPYYDYQFGQAINTLSAEPTLAITGIEQVTGGWAITVAVKDNGSALDIGKVQIDGENQTKTSAMNAELQVLQADTIAGLASAEATAYPLVVDDDTKSLTVVVDEGAFFKAKIVYANAPSTQQQGGGEQGGLE